MKISKYKLKEEKRSIVVKDRENKIYQEINGKRKGITHAFKGVGACRI